MPTLDAITPPKPSSLPSDIVKQLLINLDDKVDQLKSSKESLDMEGLLAFQRVANYLAAAQIFLQQNGLLTQPLETKHIKSRLLGHWGTCPGLNFVYAHTNYLITKHETDRDIPEFMFLTGPGHGAPALLSTLFMEGSITRFYPEYPMSREGLEHFIRSFSLPGGFPSHVNAETPGALHEGGELGYGLAVAYGSIMDKPNHITVAVIGDGESETGPTATAWHAHKYIDPAESGAVIPILHVNGYKIGERTIPGTMDDLELACLYTGYGYQVHIVEYGSKSPEEASDHEHDIAVQYDMAVAMEWAYQEIRNIQQSARSGRPITKPRWPMIIMRTPKGWTGPKKAEGHIIEGNWRAHQVPLPKAGAEGEEFELLKKWLHSYGPEELFHVEVDSNTSQAHNAGNKAEGIIDSRALRIIPKDQQRRMGMVNATYRGFLPLETPEWKEYGHDVEEKVSNMKAVGDYVAKIIEMNPSTFRIFSPDEITSNKLDAALDVTQRNFQWDPETANKGGRVIEMLSEHTLQGWMQGYTLTGRHALFPSYESFLGIVQTMIEQYAKFLKMALETKWRSDVSGLTYIETSTLWRQEHNGYSHQNPGLIGSFISLPRHLARIYLPPDANSSVATIDHCLRSKNNISLVIGSKNPTKGFLTIEEAEKHCIAGASVWEKFSSDKGVNPDVVLVGCGVEVTFEVIAAAAILRNHGVKVRVVNVTDLLILGRDGIHPHALDQDAFDSLFTADKPVVFNFHGYPKDVAALLFSRRAHVGRSRFDILGYIEEGSTTTAYSMLRLNNTSRYSLADIAVRRVARDQPNHPINVRAHELSSYWRHQLVLHDKFTKEYGKDPEWCGEIPELEKDAA
ncbi:phosphoketolase [Cryptococcus deuterogattii 99/473]|uniref:Unplaced genomic scaffold supercont1.16, whole genome shotgun sequence n=1 Tax=Cryptococcus deuterogattii Ram5 TaxID=1296110 RepID=A0A0D0UZV3_9TREE|nr:phosphoketolase [Cryptococcus deuterogattii LA55]KIR34700.1 phosphoketolase [Cryptococcus deuterogattii MMRL2647]KIR38160.1 phosphoketolase [Cryptococcus deuterogattii Ram5]KIR73700.1 phosphoketolase [Cryptococcus deuterogattii CA1014]KIR93191.1 phosphoketolase [Cryptococcus deuterogattii CBS 10090]KIR99545.1 phosphoketolase [Cryptococcus deuterogattii 2001/935-1]KIY58262.1 phosphoketolase [Cryptococcus deuterogattii 99/473]